MSVYRSDFENKRLTKAYSARVEAYDNFYAECAKKAHGDPFLLHELLRGKIQFTSHHDCLHDATPQDRRRCRNARKRAERAAAERDAR